ncbi:MAG: thioesterase domain-containing protein [Acidimicrobiales bacterium]
MAQAASPGSRGEDVAIDGLATTGEHWFATPRPVEGPTLFCLPYAGGGATVFWGWQQRFSSRVAVEPVHLPGRDGHLDEHPQLSAPDVASSIAQRARTPYALYGHSMGARLGFEVVRELRRRGTPLPVCLFVGAAHPPHLPEPLARIVDLDEAAFVEHLIARAGAPAELRDDRDVRELILPALRADFAWLKQYRYRPEPPLPVPIVAFAGADDRVLPPTSMLGWARHSAVGLRLHTLPGNHVFFQSAPERLVELVDVGLAAAVDAATATATTATATTRVGTVAGGLDHDEVHVWLAPLDRLPGHCAASDELSPRERERATAFRHERDRRRFVGRSVVLRRLLRRYGVEVGTAELHTGPRGKPYVTGADLRFSLSHSDGQVLVAVTRGHEVGVDIERLRPMADFAAFCEGALDPEERAELNAVSEETRLQLGLNFWTAKEAVLKASGDGLSVEPTELGFTPQPPGVPWQARTGPGLEKLRSWRVTHLPLDGAIGTVAVTMDDWRLRYETVTEAR